MCWDIDPAIFYCDACNNSKLLATFKKKKDNKKLTTVMYALQMYASSHWL